MSAPFRPDDVAGRINRLVGVDARPDFNLLHAQLRRADEAGRMSAMLARAVPPPDMVAAPVAPARGPMALQPIYDMQAGGTRRRVGAHFRPVCALEAAVANARARHEARGGDVPFVPPYLPGQIAMAAVYRTLVEHRDGSGMRCASLEAGREGGGGSGLFIDTFIAQGQQLAELQARIGSGVAMDVRRHMDRGNGRRAITVRAAVDLVVIAGQDVSVVLKRYGWQADGKNRKVLRVEICRALDRMQGCV